MKTVPTCVAVRVRIRRCATFAFLAIVALIAGCESQPTGRRTRAEHPTPPRPVVTTPPVMVVTRHDATEKAGGAVKSGGAPSVRPTQPPRVVRPDPTPAPPPSVADPVGAEPVVDDLAMTPEEAQRLAQGYLRRLVSADREDAEAAYRELWEMPREIVPLLLREVENRKRTHFKSLRVAVFQPVGQVAENDAGVTLAYYVPGFAGVKIDDIAGGVAPSRRAYDVRLRRKTEGFQLGAVVRGALLNRFRSPDYPKGNDRHDPRGWWQEYYRRVKSRL